VRSPPGRCHVSRRLAVQVAADGGEVRAREASAGSRQLFEESPPLGHRRRTVAHLLAAVRPVALLQQLQPRRRAGRGARQALRVGRRVAGQENLPDAVRAAAGSHAHQRAARPAAQLLARPRRRGVQVRAREKDVRRVSQIQHGTLRRSSGAG